MNFAKPSYLWFLAIVLPGLMLFFWWSWRARQALAAKFIQARLLPGLMAGVSPARQKVRAACLMVAAACLIIALGRPQWGYDLEEVRQRGLDIIVAIDTSKSMLATDTAPNRLTRAKLAALDLMQQAKSDRLGLVAFAGSAFLQCPLTIDDSAFRQSVEALDVNTLPEGGTALGEAIETALKAYKEEDSFKVLVLFTDGEDHDSGAVDAAKKAAEAGMRIFTIGIGSAEGELLRIQGPDGQADYVRDEQGNVVKSHLNEGLLQNIAQAANGYYFPLRGANTIDMLYQQFLATLPKSESREQWVKRPRERYHWPLALAILLLAVEMFIPERKRELKKTAAEPAKSAPALAALLALLLLPAAASGSSSSALREYRSGNYGTSLKEYEELLQRKKDDPRLHFNAGAAAYRSNEYGQATNYFGRALTSPDLKLQEQAYYNLGNALYHLGDQDPDPSRRTRHWEQSLTNYSNSLKLDPQDSDAKFNYELVKRKLEELKQQQQQQQKSTKDQDQKNQSKDQQQQNQDQQQKQDQKQDSNQNQKSDQKSEQKPDQKPEQKNQQQSQQQPPEKKQQSQKDEGRSSESQKSEQETGDQKEGTYAGQMTPEQAKQLLDAQKNAEMVLPAKPEPKTAKRSGPRKDW